MKYYLITCMRGHCGVGRANEISFAIEAANLLEATDKARRMPSVKHTHNRAILAGKEISYVEYVEYRSISAYERRPQGSWDDKSPF